MSNVQPMVPSSHRNTSLCAAMYDEGTLQAQSASQDAGVPPLWYSSSESSPLSLAAFSFRSTVETPEDGRNSSSSSSDASDWVLPIPREW
jgi:hypothetical protein